MGTEPQTIRDVWYMEKTSSRCHLYYKSLCNFDNMEVGIPVEQYTDVEVDFSYSTIYVVQYESQCVKIDRDHRSYSTVSKEMCRQGYHNIDDFKHSPYYEDFISVYKDGNADSSWFDDVEIAHNEKDGFIQIDCELGEPGWDWLNRRHTIATRHRPFSLSIDTRYGTIDIDSNDKVFTFTLKELMNMIETFKLLENNNIKIDKYSGIKISWKEYE